MRIAHRMLLAVLPAILGLFTVAGLAYWGRYAREVPTLLVAVAAVAAVATLGLAWRATRHVVHRVERLAGSTAPEADPARVDELDSIERVVTRVHSVEEDSRQRERAAGERVQEYARLLAEASAAVSGQLDQIRIPLHILLENHFGDLNENQEEMLAAAQAAAETAEAELRRLREIAELDRGALNLRRDLVPAGDLLRSLLPLLEAQGERLGVHVTADLAPGLPRVPGDRHRLQEALSLLLAERVRYAPRDSTVNLTAEAERDRVRIRIEHGSSHPSGAEVVLARRLIEAHGGTVEEREGFTVIELPSSKVILPASSL